MNIFMLHRSYLITTVCCLGMALMGLGFIHQHLQIYAYGFWISCALFVVCISLWMIRFVMHQSTKLRLCGALTLSMGIGMFFFSYAMVPMYHFMCAHMGINGKIHQNILMPSKGDYVDKSRIIEMRVVTNASVGGPSIVPVYRMMNVHPGADFLIEVVTKNTSLQSVALRNRLSITPGSASRYVMAMNDFDQSVLKLPPGASERLRIPLHLSNTYPNQTGEIAIGVSQFQMSD